MWTTAEAELLLPSVSVVEVATVTLLVMSVPRIALSGRTTTVTVCCEPLLMVPRLQISWLLPGPVGAAVEGWVAQLPVVGEAET